MRLLIPARSKTAWTQLISGANKRWIAVRLPEVKGFAEFLQQLGLPLLVGRAKSQQVAQHADGIVHVGLDLRQQGSAERSNARIDLELIAKNDLTPIAAGSAGHGNGAGAGWLRWRGHGDGLGDGGHGGTAGIGAAAAGIG